jgi:glycine hydroxymethyltransferase
MAAAAATDSILTSLIAEEQDRQNESLELIASENFTSHAVLECLGSILTNKYSEGYAGRRYYGGNHVIDKIERLAQDRALAAFSLDPAAWAVNVQPYSGSTANAAVYLGLLQPHDRIMGLDLPSGGHLTHGFMTAKRRVSATSVYYESIPYQVGADGLIDYAAFEKLALIVKPRLIICGYSAYSRDLDYARFRSVADKVGAYLMCDMAHFSGFVATGLLVSPFAFADIVTTTTHKTLRGPRAGMIFTKTALQQRINDAVFPGLQGGPHVHQIAGIAAQMLEVATPAFRDYMEQVRANTRALAGALMKKGFNVVTGGTDNHMFLLNVREFGLSGAQAEAVLEACNVSVNKNTIAGDTSALNPSGIRIGLPAMTTRGMKEADMEWVAEIIEQALSYGALISTLAPGPLLAPLSAGSQTLLSPAEFKERVQANEILASLQEEVRVRCRLLRAI